MARQIFLGLLAHACAIGTRPFLLPLKGPGNEANIKSQNLHVAYILGLMLDIADHKYSCIPLIFIQNLPHLKKTWVQLRMNFHYWIYRTFPALTSDISIKYTAFIEHQLIQPVIITPVLQFLVFLLNYKILFYLCMHVVALLLYAVKYFLFCFPIIRKYFPFFL